ncbi:MAG TPA: hypothetical protein VIT65_10675 [Microlunatus sp.]
MPESLDRDTSLNDEQMARAEALAFARSALADEVNAPLSHRDSLPKRFGVEDLLGLAEYVLHGIPSDGRTITVVVVPDDTVEAVSRLNPAENFRPGGLLIVPESVDHSRVTFEREATE